MSKSNFKTKYTAKRLAVLAVLCAMGLVTFMIESLFPPLFLPGAKMGLSNIFSLLAIFLLSPADAVIVVTVRTTLGSIFTGNMSTLLYSLSAGLVSVAVSSVLVEFVFPKISVVAISVVSAILHNLTQNIVFCLVSNTPEMFAYMPWLAVLGAVAGIVVGFAVWLVLKTVPLKVLASFGSSDEAPDKNFQKSDVDVDHVVGGSSAKAKKSNALFGENKHWITRSISNVSSVTVEVSPKKSVEISSERPLEIVVVNNSEKSRAEICRYEKCDYRGRSVVINIVVKEKGKTFCEIAKQK